MKYTEQTYKDIEEIQHLIKEKGLQDWGAAREIMNISTEKSNEEYDYYKNLEGKYLKSVNQYTHVINYYHIHKGIKLISGGWMNKPVVYVKVDNYSFKANGDVQFWSEKDHVLTTASVGRYDDCRIIPQEEFEREMTEIQNLIEDFSRVYDELNN